MLKRIKTESNSNRTQSGNPVCSSFQQGQRSQGWLWDRVAWGELTNKCTQLNTEQHSLRGERHQQIWDEKCVTPSGGQDGGAGGDKIPGKSWQWEIPAQMYRSTAIKNGLLNHHRWKRKCWFQANATITLPAPWKLKFIFQQRKKKSWRKRQQRWGQRTGQG